MRPERLYFPGARAPGGELVKRSLNSPCHPEQSLARSTPQTQSKHLHLEPLATGHISRNFAANTHRVASNI